MRAGGPSSGQPKPVQSPHPLPQPEQPGTRWNGPEEGGGREAGSDLQSLERGEPLKGEEEGRKE